MKPTFSVDQNFGGVGPDFLLVEGGDGEDGLLEVVPAPEPGGSFGLVAHAQRTDACSQKFWSSCGLKSFRLRSKSVTIRDVETRDTEGIHYKYQCTTIPNTIGHS